MKAALRELLRRKVSPQVFEAIRHFNWLCSFYLPRRVAAIFIRRTPKIYDFSGSHASEPLAQQLRGINVFGPTKMCRVMTRHGSDKGRGWHNYTTIYSVLLRNLNSQPLVIFELGLGTNNPELLSTMGVTGKPGASLRGWRELFPRSLVYGADIDRSILFEEERIKTYYCDQLDGAAVRDLWTRPGLDGGADILVEDGLHTFEANISFLNGALERLRPGGIYVVEDIRGETMKEWPNHLGSVLAKQFPKHEFALVALPNPLNECDNNLLIIRRPR
jgi:hypothetical protein